MRLYNPKFGKETKKELNKKKRRNNFITALIWLTVLAAIGGLVCCIVFKTKWYFYVADVVGCIILLIIFSCCYAKKEEKYVDIPIEETEEEFVQRNLKELTPENVMSNVMRREGDASFFGGSAYKGIWKGIAVCECGRLYELQNLAIDVSNRTSTRTSDENSNMNFYETATVKVSCTCSKCGKESENWFYEVKRSTGSIRRKQELFSNHVTVTTRSCDADYAGYVEEVYKQDLAQYKSDCDKYKEIIKNKTDELHKRFKPYYEANLRRIESLRAHGWYEKPTKAAKNGSDSELDK